VQFVKYAAEQIKLINKEKLEKQSQEAEAGAAEKSEAIEEKKQQDKTAEEAEESEDQATKQIKELASSTNLPEESSHLIIQKACKHVNSYKPNEFDIRFNMNLFQPCVRLVEDEQLASDKQQLKEACAFLLEVQVPGLVKDLLEHAIFITDGVTLCETMHSRGINIRYLGYLVQQIAEHETLSYIHVSVLYFCFC